MDFAVYPVLVENSAPKFQNTGYGKDPQPIAGQCFLPFPSGCPTKLLKKVYVTQSGQA
jgi:hypothetical protein